MGYLLGRIGVAIVLIPHLFRGESFTLYEILGYRFGPRVRQLTSGLFIITRTIADGLRLFLTAIIVHELTRWDFSLAILAVGTATIIYTFLGGIRAIVWTDFLQFFVYMIGAFVAGWILVCFSFYINIYFRFNYPGMHQNTF